VESTRRYDGPVSSSGPRVSVVIPVLNEERRLAGCLNRLAGQRDAPTFEVLIVDNGSRDATVSIAEEHAVRPRVLREPARGPYAARNAGIAAASGEIVAFTDADCLPEPEWLAAGCAAMDAGTDLVGGTVEQIAGPNPSVWERYDRATYLKQDHFVAVDRFAATANLFVRAEVFARLGPFVPELTASGDIEFGRRAVAAGYRLVYAGGAKVLHHPRTTMREMWALHRKLGSGFAELARYGVRERPWNDASLRIGLGTVVDDVAADGPRLRFRQLAPVHAVVMTARWVGRLTGRG
jgi:glycosyltransferase involved in cell wall biosynthesis